MNTNSQDVMKNVLAKSINSYLKEMQVKILEQFDKEHADEVREAKKEKENALKEIISLVGNGGETVKESIEDIVSYSEDYSEAEATLRKINKMRGQIRNVISDLKLQEK